MNRKSWKAQDVELKAPPMENKNRIFDTTPSLEVEVSSKGKAPNNRGGIFRPKA
jgi:hypothetical protein